MDEQTTKGKSTTDTVVAKGGKEKSGGKGVSKEPRDRKFREKTEDEVLDTKEFWDSAVSKSSP
jgi:uncharacterized protein YfiM (DUF2279 family)